MLTFNADPIKGMTLFGGYSYIDAQNTVIRTPSLLGTQLPNAPRHSGSLFVKYRVQSGLLRALGLGLGARRVGTTHGPSNSVIEMPPYNVVTVQADYTWRKYTFNIAVNNVFDTVYWPRPNAFGGNRAGDPLSFRSSVRARF
jgi:iron complex outermembrane receptor protein